MSKSQKTAHDVRELALLPEIEAVNGAGAFTNPYGIRTSPWLPM